MSKSPAPRKSTRRSRGEDDIPISLSRVQVLPTAKVSVKVSKPTTPEVGTKKRGKPSASPQSNVSTPGGGARKAVSRTIMQKIIKSLPDDSQDDDDNATCSECSQVFSNYRAFRLHNIELHLNTACTSQEKISLVMDHKFFARKLNEFKKLTGGTVFACPKSNCESSYKSTLGLAYHMTTCGRTSEEIDAVLIPCDVCNQKFTLPNLGWHKRTHQVNLVVESEDEEVRGVKILSVTGKPNKRKSAVKARQSFKKMSDGGDDDQPKSKSSRKGKRTNDDSDYDDDAPEGVTTAQGEEVPEDDTSTAAEESQTTDFCSLAVKFLDKLSDESKTWDIPTRNLTDPFPDLEDNQFFNPEEFNDDLESYLPIHKESVEFKHVSDEGSSNYHKLSWFEGETVCPENRTSASLHHTGGTVLSMSWHPSGKLLAVSVGRDMFEDIDLHETQMRKTCVQIYNRSLNSLSLQLVVGVPWGYATHIQWSSFYPDIMDSYNPSGNSCFDDIEIYCKLAYLAMTCEDSSVRIMVIRIEDLKLKPNFEYKPGFWVSVYSKIPEFCLQLDETTIDDDLGVAVKFDWHENNRFFAVGYANGMIAMYDLMPISPLLVKKVVNENSKTTVVNPFWIFHGHRLSIRGICFDPMNPRYLVTASYDRTIKVWDTHTRLVRECKKVGIVLDMCWIRGWLHQAVTCEAHITFQSAMCNYIRVYQIGNALGKPTYGEIFNATTLDFHQGLTIQGTDNGGVSATYYDIFWRECDFERNKKKKNLVHLCSTKVDRDSYTEITKNDFTINLRKLTETARKSELYHTAIENEDLLYEINLKNEFDDEDVYEHIPTIGGSDNESDAEDNNENETLESETESEIVEKVCEIESEMEDVKLYDGDGFDEDETEMTEISDEMALPGSDKKKQAVTDAIDAISTPKNQEGLVPVYSVDLREKEESPRIILSFIKKRATTSAPNDVISHAAFEEYVRFQPFLRINKVAWSPDGELIAVGYRNGLISVMPGKFESIFS